jgi:uncharacterized protein YggE
MAKAVARHLIVHGHGRAAQPADVADVVLGVDLVRPTAGEARDAAAEAMTGVVVAVRAMGVADDAIRTTDLALAPEIEYRPDGTTRRTGFRLTNRITVRLRDVGRVAELVDAAIAAGASSLDGVTFAVADASAARADALVAAVADATRAAETLAQAAGAELGDVTDLVEGAGAGPLPTPRMAMLEAKAADTPVLAGFSEVTASVTITWELRPRGPEHRPA